MHNMAGAGIGCKLKLVVDDAPGRIGYQAHMVDGMFEAGLHNMIEDLKLGVNSNYIYIHP